MAKTINRNISISKIKLVDDGRKGLKVCYEKPSKHKDFNFRDEYDAKFKAPVNHELKAAMDALRPYAMDILQLHKKNVAAEDVRVIGVSSNADSKFVITVMVRSYGSKEYTTNTPCFQESDASDYKDFHAVIELIRNVYNEARMYVSEARMMDVAQLSQVIASDIARKNDDFDPNSVHNMSPAELTAFCRQHLEQAGAVVMLDDESDAGAGEDVPPPAKKETPVISMLPLTATAPAEEAVAVEAEEVPNGTPVADWGYDEPQSEVAGGLY